MKTDFRKWILDHHVSLGKEGIDNLCRSLENQSSYDSFTLQKHFEANRLLITIRHTQVDSVLNIAESDASTFLDYLNEHYVPAKNEPDEYLSKNDSESSDHDVMTKPEKKHLSVRLNDASPLTVFIGKYYIHLAFGFFVGLLIANINMALISLLYVLALILFASALVIIAINFVRGTRFGLGFSYLIFICMITIWASIGIKTIRYKTHRTDVIEALNNYQSINGNFPETFDLVNTNSDMFNYRAYDNGGGFLLSYSTAAWRIHSFNSKFGTWSSHFVNVLKWP